MILYLYIQIKPAGEIRFTSPIGNWIKSLKQDLTCAELDNHSENFLVDQTAKLIPEASKIIFHLDISGDQSTGATRLVFEALRKAQKPTFTLVTGSHKQLESMLKMMKLTPKKIESDEEAETHISSFLNF